MVVLSVFFREKIVSQETIRELLCLYASRSSMNSLMMFIICSSIRMSELKYSGSFIAVLFIWQMKDVILEYRRLSNKSIDFVLVTSGMLLFGRRQMFADIN
jgi:hypothetical protein